MKYFGMILIFFFINGGYIYIYNVIDVCMIKGNENVLVFIKLLLDLFYSYKYYIKIILSFVELILKVSYYFLIF